MSTAETALASKISALEGQIFELTQELNSLRKSNPGTVVPNYSFTTQNGDTSLLDLFGDAERLLVVHNMGQGCRYCTLWADGFNGLLPHLESAMAVVLVSKDDPALQRRFANQRGWRFRLASHQGSNYLAEQGLAEDFPNMPGAVVYERQGSTIRRTNSALFGPGDVYCSAWGLLALAGLGEAEFTPQFGYWQRPAELDDGGANIVD